MSILIKSETAKVNWEEYVGDTLWMEFALFSDSESTVPVDLSDTSIQFVLKNNEKTTLIDISTPHAQIVQVPYTGELDNVPTQVALKIIVTEEQTTTLSSGVYTYAIVVTELNGFVNTLFSGKLTLIDRFV